MLVVVDNLTVVNQLGFGSVDYSSHRDNYLWGEFWRLADSRMGCLVLFWFKAHMTVASFIRTCIPNAIYLANQVADFLANSGASECQISEWAVRSVVAIRQKHRLIQDRIVTIGLGCSSSEIPDAERKPEFVRLLKRFQPSRVPNTP